MCALSIFGCDDQSGANEDLDPTESAGGKADDISGEAWDEYDDVNKIPDAMFEFLSPLNWGAMHDDYHTGRKLGENPSWADDFRTRSGGEDPPTFPQEGTAGSGMDFCMMHSVMMSVLLENAEPSLREIGVLEYNEPNADIDQIVADFLRDRVESSDQIMSGAPVRENADAWVSSLQYGQERLDKIQNDPNSTLDEFCIEFETSRGQTERFSADGTPESTWGIHNGLHGWLGFTEPSTRKIGIVDARLNLYNRDFYLIHGYVEARFREYMDEHYPNCPDSFAKVNQPGVSDETCGPHYTHMLHHHMEMMSATEAYPVPQSNNLYQQPSVPPDLPDSLDPESDVLPPPADGDGGGRMCEEFGGSCYQGENPCWTNEVAVRNTNCASTSVCCVAQ